jgi:ParB family chromosome partitioning protein
MKIKLSQIREPERAIRAMIDEDSIRELALSMQKLGQLQPIGVKRVGKDEYEIVFGHRRYLAAKFLGWKEIRAEIVSDEGSFSEAAKLVENTQREQLTPVEEAYALAELQRQLGGSTNELARVTGKSTTWIRSRLEILEWPEEIQAAVHADLISIGVARQLARLHDPNIRTHYLEAAIRSGCTESMAEVWVNAAIAAEQGIAAAKSLEQVQSEMEEMARGMEQRYRCYCCREEFSWRRVNLVVMCGNCQDRIAEIAAAVEKRSGA